LYVDLEGIGLCRHGSISLPTLLIHDGTHAGPAYLFDVHTLGQQAFNTAGMMGKTLKDILEDEDIPKVFFDVRNDSDALFAHFGVRLQGVEDVQLMESATRPTTASGRLLSGLARCIKNSPLMPLGSRKLRDWKQAKEKGERLFKSQLGGSYEIFNERPIPLDIISYCVGDVQCLPELRRWFLTTRSSAWRALIVQESKNRVADSHKPNYQPYGRDRALAPWSAEQHRLLDKWHTEPPSDYFDDWYDGRDDNDYEDWTKADWQLEGPPS
jgi:exonuclease 3'-5' domain-containing protein 1